MVVDVVVAAAAALDASRVERVSSSRISSSRVLFSSLEAFLNSARLLPSERPSSGSLRGPKIIRAITKMMINSGMPIEPNIRAYFPKTEGQTTDVNYRNRRRKGQEILPHSVPRSYCP